MVAELLSNLALGFLVEKLPRFRTKVQAMKGDVFFRKGDYLSAREVYWELMLNHSLDERTYSDVALKHASTFKYTNEGVELELMLRSVEMAIERDKTNGNLYFARGVILSQMNDTYNAIEDLIKAITHGTVKQEQSYFHLGIEYFSQKNSI
jgi:tetratricopeptide (TPR) repeat protein